MKVEKEKELEKSGMNWWLFGGIIVGLLVIGGLVWFLLVRCKRKKEEEEYEEYLVEDEIVVSNESILEIFEEKIVLELKFELEELKELMLDE